MNHLSQEPFVALGIDVGGTKTAAGIVSFPDGQVRERRIIPTAPARGGEALLSDVVRLADELVHVAGLAGLKAQAVGIGLCELVDPKGGILSANCVQWMDQPVREQLSHLGPVFIEADVRAAGLAEAFFGGGKPFKQFLYVTVGTGISCCLMIDGKPFTGARGASGTMASSPLGVTCGKCGHVNERSLEEVASGPALVGRLNQHRPDAARTAQDVLAAAAAGQPEAIHVVRSGGEALGVTVGLLVNTLDPEAIIVGGGVGMRNGCYWESFITSTRRQIWSEVHRDLPIIHAGTGADAGLLGAAGFAWRNVCQATP